jgi:hypothetical protein
VPGPGAADTSRPGRALARFRAARVLLVTGGVVLAAAVLEPGSRAVAAVSGDPAVAAATLPGVIQNLTAWLTGIAATAATMFLTYGGIRYLSAGGDPGQVQKAKHALYNAAIGYGVAILAPVIMTVLKGLVGG